MLLYVLGGALGEAKKINERSVFYLVYSIRWRSRTNPCPPNHSAALNACGCTSTHPLSLLPTENDRRKRWIVIAQFLFIGLKTQQSSMTPYDLYAIHFNSKISSSSKRHSRTNRTFLECCETTTSTGVHPFGLVPLCLSVASLLRLLLDLNTRLQSRDSQQLSEITRLLAKHSELLMVEVVEDV